MNGDTLVEGGKRFFIKEFEALKGLIAAFITQKQIDESSLTSIEAMKQDLEKLKAISEKFPELGIANDTPVEDAEKLLDSEDFKEYKRISGGYLFDVVVDPEFAVEVGDMYKQEGIPYSIMQIKVDGKLAKMFMTDSTHDKEIQGLIEKRKKSSHKIVRSGNIVYTMQGDYGFFTEDKFKAKLATEDKNCVKIPAVDNSVLSMARNSIIESHKTVCAQTFEGGKDSRDLYVLEEDKGLITSLLALSEMYKDTAYGKYIKENNRARSNNLTKISAGLSSNSTFYILGELGYIKVTPAGFECYDRDGKFESNLIRETGSTDFKNKLINACHNKLGGRDTLAQMVCVDEKDFIQDNDARFKFYLQNSDFINLQTENPLEMHQISLQKELREPIEKLFFKANNRNYKAILDRNLGVNRIIGLQLRAALLKQLKDNYEVTKAAINSRSDFKFAVPEYKDIEEELRYAIQDADVATTKFLDTVLITEDGKAAKESIKDGFMNIFNKAQLSADFNETLKLAQSVERALERATDRMEKTVEVDATLDEIIVNHEKDVMGHDDHAHEEDKEI